MINALRCGDEKLYLLNFGHADNDHDRRDYDDIDGAGDDVGHNHINSDYDEYDIGDQVSKAL